MKSRTELHLHTNMSIMDGLTDVKRLFERAEKENMKAVAITDHGVCHAFPEIYKVVNEKQYKVKPIYGMEGYLLDDDSEESLKSEIDSLKPYHIIIQVKNMKGLRNLYKLVSLSHMFYVMKEPLLFNVPLIPKSLLKSHREGLIIGTACEAGQFYREVRKNKPIERLMELAEFYDYLELQPLANNRFLINFNMVKDINALKSINKKVFEIGCELGKPVCATCDAHYLNKIDSVARKAVLLAKGMPSVEGEPGIYLRNAEEMFDEFLYFGESAAEEIVFDNPNKIADMVEDIVIEPPDFSRTTDKQFLPGGFMVPYGKIETMGEEMAKKSLDEYLRIAPYEVRDKVTNDIRQDLIEIIKKTKTGISKSENGFLAIPKGQEAERLAPLQYSQNNLEKGELITHYDVNMWRGLM